MKRLIGLILLSGAFALPAKAGVLVSGNISTMTRVSPVSFTAVQDVSAYQKFSVQATYADGTPSGHNIVDGRKSTATITVSSASYVFASTPSLSINGVTITYIPVATASGTAKVISDTITANGSLNTIIVTSWTIGGVVTATSSAVGINAYSLTSSSQAALRVSASFLNGLASDIDLDANTIAETSHGLVDGLKVLYASSTVTTGIGGLQGGTTYFAIRVSDNSYKLASTAANAIAGTAVDITSQPGAQTFSVTPLAISAGSAGFHWQASNDGTNFANLATTTISSVTYTSAGTSFWDFGATNFKYLRINFVGPTNGALNLSVTIAGRKED